MVVRRPGRACTMLLLAALLWALPATPAPAAAHGYIAESSPADGETLAAGPDEIRVVFTEPFEPGVSSLTLTDAQGREIPGTLEHLPGNSEMRLALAAPLPAGEYRVTWRILAADGHVTEGTIGFTVEGSADATAEPEPQPQPEPQPAGDKDAAGTTAGPGEDGASSESTTGSTGAPALPLAGAAVLLAGVAAWVIRRWRS